MKRFLDGRICLRRALSLYLDAKEHIRSCEGEDELCSVCVPPPSTSPPYITTPARTTALPPATPQSTADGASRKPQPPLMTPASSSTTTSFSFGQPTPTNAGKRPPPTPDLTPDTGYYGGPKRRRENMAHECSDMERYTELLQLFSQTCGYCRQTGHDCRHPPIQCRYRADYWWDVWKAARSRNGPEWLPNYVICFMCLHPQQVCTVRGPKKAGGCEYPDVVLSACLGLWASPLAGTFLQGHFHFQPETKEQFVDWLGGKTEFGGGPSINAVRVTDAVLRKFYDDGMAAVNSSPLAAPSMPVVSRRGRAYTPEHDERWRF